MVFPSFEEAYAIKDQYKLIPIVFEVPGDTQTPIQLFLSLKNKNEQCFLLESISNSERWGRYSFIGIRPEMTIKIKDNDMTIRRNEDEMITSTQRPMDDIKKILEEFRSPKIKGIPNLSGGLVGYFSYDTVRYIEGKLDKPPMDDLNLPDCYFMVSKEIIAFDHLKQKISIIINISTEGDFKKSYEEAIIKAKKMIRDIETPPLLDKPVVGKRDIEISSNITKEKFIENVMKAKKSIYDGEIFQIVLSQRLEVSNAPEPFETYRILRSSNPSPYMYYFQLDNHIIVGSSPEMLVKVEDDRVATRPIAGTIKRGRDDREDKVLEVSLLGDEKERAEHMMLVDLGRNDVGKVCVPSTVKVTSLMKIEKYSQVMHLVSDIQGVLEEKKDGVDALLAVLPAGTLSGAPKVRAMELIDEMESSKRGLYGGTIGYLGFNGDIDTCIAIRTILYKNDKAYIQVGAGIVADSIPEKEFEETQSKAKAMINAIREEGKNNDFND